MKTSPLLRPAEVTHAMRRNTKLLIPLNSIGYLCVWFSFYVLFFLGQGLTLGEIGLIMAVGQIVLCAANIPAGRLADSYSYRGCLLMGYGLMAVAFVAMTLGGGFWLTLSWMVVLNFGTALAEGADMGLAKTSFDYLKPVGTKDDLSFERFSSLNTAVVYLSQATGGFIATRLTRLFGAGAPQVGMWAQAGVFLVSAGTVWLLKEPPRDVQAKKPFRELFVVRGDRARPVRGQPAIYWGALYLAALAALLALPFVILAQTIRSLDVGEIWIGITLTIWLLIGAVASLLMYRYGGRVKPWRVLKWLLPIALAAIAAFVLLPGKWIIVGAALSAAAGATTHLTSAPFLTNLMDQYATVVSVYTSLNAVMYAAAFYGMNVVVEHWSVRGAFLVGLLVFGGISCVAFVGLSRALRTRRA